MIGLANQVWDVFLGEMLAPEKLVLKALKRLHEHVQDEFDVACTWRRSARFLTRCIRKTGFLQSRKEERLVKNRKTSKENSVEVSVKKPVESTVENRLEEVVQIQKDREEGKDSLKKKMTNTCNERKQPEKVPVKAGKKKHSGSKKSKAKKTVTKSPNHGQEPVKTQKKALNNRVKRSGNEKEERVVPHTESKRVRLEEEIKQIQSKEVSTEKKEQSTMSEEKKDSEILFQEVKEVMESSRLSASSSDKKVATSYGRKFFDFLNFLWWRENKKENAETTLGDSKSVGVSTVDEAVKEKAGAKRKEDLLASTEKKMINTHCMKEENSEKVVSEDNEDVVLSGTDKEKKEECELEEETKTVEQKHILHEKKLSSVLSSKRANLDVPVEDVDGCTDRRIAIPHGIRNTAYSGFSGFGGIGGRQGLKSRDMSWAYSRSLRNGSFGYGEVAYRLVFKRPLGKKPLEELTLFAPRKAERRGTVRYRIKSAREEYRKLKPTLAARERERSEGGRDRAG